VDKAMETLACALLVYPVVGVVGLIHPSSSPFCQKE